MVLIVLAPLVVLALMAAAYALGHLTGRRATRRARATPPRHTTTAGVAAPYRVRSRPGAPETS